MGFSLRPIVVVLVSLVLLCGCADGGRVADEPSAAYRNFFHELDRGNTQRALERLAPDGALGNTFQSAGYYMLAQTVGRQLEEHGGLDAVVIDREEIHEDETVTIEGRLIMRDGTEVHRRIRFTFEGGRWVGRV